MSEPLLTEEDRVNIKLIAEELPKLRHLIEELSLKFYIAI